MGSSSTKKNIIGLLLSMLISLIIVLVSFRIWEMNLRIPVDHAGDGVLALTIFKSICKNGIKGLYICTQMGAPEVASFVDTPFIDTALAGEVWILDKILPNYNMVFYVDYFLTFPLAAFTMYLLLNKLSNNNAIKVFLSVSFAITPYHFYRGLGHLTLSHYYVVPIAVYLMLLIYEDEFKGVAPKRYVEQKWKIILMYVGCMILGLANVYYAFFGLICMATALILKMIKTKKVKCLIKEAAPIYVVLFFVLVGLLPKIIYTIKNGKNLFAGVRLPLEAEIFALKIIQLLLPCAYNNVSFLKKINEKYTQNAYNINENLDASLGVIATIGFVIACIWIIRKVCMNIKQSKSNDRMTIIAFTILVVILYSVAGGFGAFINYWVTPEIRCFNRSSIFIVCLSLSILAISTNYIVQRYQKKCFLTLGMGLISVFAIYSEVDYRESNWQKTYQMEYNEFNEFFSNVDSVVNNNEMVYQLPYMEFPETADINDMHVYEPALGYLYSDKIHWSYGAVKGRQRKSEQLNINNGMGDFFVSEIKKTGFAGVYIDTKGYADQGKEILDYYMNDLNLSPIISSSGWLYYFDISSVELDNRKVISDYYFFDKLSEELDVDASIEDLARLSKGVLEKDGAVYSIVWDWLSISGLNNDNNPYDYYITKLYNLILQREPSEDEIIYWENKRLQGCTRYEAMQEFLTCGEFLTKFTVK